MGVLSVPTPAPLVLRPVTSTIPPLLLIVFLVLSKDVLKWLETRLKLCQEQGGLVN